MFRRLTIVAGLVAAVGASALGAGLAGVADVAAQGQVRIELDCVGTPEETTITNRSAKEIEIEAVGSLVGREKAEPHKVRNVTLKRGQSVTFESGEDARGGDVLTKRELYDDESNREGAKVRTSIGTFKERCS